MWTYLRISHHPFYLTGWIDRKVEWESGGSRNLGHGTRWHRRVEQTNGEVEMNEWTLTSFPSCLLTPHPLFTTGVSLCVFLCRFVLTCIEAPLWPSGSKRVCKVCLGRGSSCCWVISWGNIRSNRPLAVRLSRQYGCRRAGFFRFQSSLLPKKGVNEWTSTYIHPFSALISDKAL